MNLVIGNTSQLSHYFPEDYIKISSRNVNFEYLRDNRWDSVYITFAEQRVHSSDIKVDYLTTNYTYTLDIINSLASNSNKICCYMSCEVWNDLSGVINIQTPPQYQSSNDYIKSKLLLFNKIKELSASDPNYRKVIFIYPFYFNSVYRNKYFLFGKIFDSIINRNKVNVGNLDFCRDMVHASFVAKQSMEAHADSLVGAGQLFNVRKFIQDLYALNDLDFFEYVQEDLNQPNLGRPKLITAQVPWIYTYQDLLQETQQDILAFRKKEENGNHRIAY